MNSFLLMIIECVLAHTASMMYCVVVDIITDDERQKLNAKGIIKIPDNRQEGSSFLL